jgi:hypothetical protein
VDKINLFEQSGTLSGGNINTIYAYNDELYFQDGAGNNVAMTSGGSVAGAAGNITTSGSPAYAASDVELLWVGGDLEYRFKAGAGDTYADLVFHEADIRNGANTMKLTSNVTSDYDINFPAAGPSVNDIISLDASGNISFTKTMGGTLAVTGLLTATGGVTCGANQDVVISGTAEYKHGAIYKQVDMVGGYSTIANIAIQANDGATPYFFWRFIGAGTTNVNFLVFPLEAEEGQTLEDIEIKHHKLVVGAEGLTVEVFRHTAVSAGDGLSSGTQIATGATGTGTATTTFNLSLSSHAVVADSNYYVSIRFTTGGISGQNIDLSNVKLGYSR